jgi:tetratricopeptide (TPR) repeat protein
MEVAGLLQGAKPKEAGRSYTLLAEIYAGIGDAARAQELFELGIELLEPYPGPYLVRACTGLAEVHEAAGRPQEALSALKRALDPRAAAGASS